VTLQRGAIGICVAASLGLGAPVRVVAAPVVIEATVEDESGRSLKDAWVWVVWDRGAPFRFEEGSRRILNPKGHTGSDGALSIEVPAGFFGEDDLLALAWQQKGEGGRSHFTALHRVESGERLNFRLRDIGTQADVGRLVAPAPREDGAPPQGGS
jgi:hypothetical protein